MGFVPAELLFTLRAYRGEFGGMPLTLFPVVIFPSEEVVRSLSAVPWFEEAVVASVENLAILHPQKSPEVWVQLQSMGFAMQERIAKEVIEAENERKSPSSFLKMKDIMGMEVKDLIGKPIVPRDRKSLEECLLEEPVGLPCWQLCEVVENAIDDRVDIFLVYYSSDECSVTQCDVMPKRLYQQSENWMLEAHCHLQNTDRHFRLHSIQAIQVMMSED